MKSVHAIADHTADPVSDALTIDARKVPETVGHDTPIGSPELRQHVKALLQHQMRHVQRLHETLAKLPLIEWHNSKATVHIPETEYFAGYDITITGSDERQACWLAAHIAAANPVAVRDILDKLEEAKAMHNMARVEFTKALRQLCNIGIYASDAIKNGIAVPDALREIHRMALTTETPHE